MLLETIFAPFVQDRPICVMARAVLERLLDAPHLDALFARTAQQQYTREILFSSLVQLMSEVVFGVHPTVHAAYQANKEALKVTASNVCGMWAFWPTGVRHAPCASVATCWASRSIHLPERHRALWNGCGSGPGST